MNLLKQNYEVISHYFLNGAYAYALYGFYAVTVTPLVINVLEKHEPTLFIAIFGLILLIAEFFALNFKLKMARIRAHEKQLLLKKQTGVSALPSVGAIVLFCFCIRLVFRMGIVMAIMTALGYDCSTTTMSVPGEIAIMSVLIFDILGFGYIYLKTDIYTDTPHTQKAFNAELKEDERWYEAAVKRISSLPYVRLEMLSDFVLQIYGLALFSSFWEFMNQAAISRLHEEINRDLLENQRVLKALEKVSGNVENLHVVNTGTGIGIVLLLFVTVMLGLIPIRIAYWVEDSMTSFSKKEKRVMWTLFSIAAIYTCSPFLAEFIAIVVFDAPQNSLPEYVQYLIAISFFLILLLLQLFWIRKDGVQGERSLKR